MVLLIGKGVDIPLENSYKRPTSAPFMVLPSVSPKTAALVV